MMLARMADEQLDESTS